MSCIAGAISRHLLFPDADGTAALLLTAVLASIFFGIIQLVSKVSRRDNRTSEEKGPENANKTQEGIGDSAEPSE